MRDDPVVHAVPDPANQVDFQLCKLDVKEFHNKLQEYSNFHADLYNLVWGQCTQSLHQ